MDCQFSPGCYIPLFTPTMNRIHSGDYQRCCFLTHVSRKSLQQACTCNFYLHTTRIVYLHSLTFEISLQDLKKGNTLIIIFKIFAK